MLLSSPLLLLLEMSGWTTSLLCVIALILLPFTISLSPHPSISRSPVPAPHSVRIEHLHLSTHPDLVIDTHTPRFHWRLPSGLQSAYQLQIAHASVDWTSADTPTSLLFNSGTTPSPLTSHHYHGPRLTSDTRYTFRLRYHPIGNSTWSQWYTASFRTALFSLQDWHGQWIGSELLNMNQVRKAFSLPSGAVRSATIFLCGLGYHRLDVNGAPVDPTRHLDPGWTTYQTEGSVRVVRSDRAAACGGECHRSDVGVGVVYARQPWHYRPWGAIPDLSDEYGP